MALSTSTITAAIAALSISGVTIKDANAIPDQVLDRDCPILFPMPGEFFEGGKGSPDDESTFGTSTTRYWHIYKTFKYLYLDSIVGSGRGINQVYADAAGRLDLIWTAILTLNVSGVDVKNAIPEKLGTVQDASGNSFIGTIWHIEVLERINA